MNEQQLLKSVKKRTNRNANTIKYGMFGLALGKETYDRLDAYCKQHHLYKATLVKALIVEYLDARYGRK